MVTSSTNAQRKAESDEYVLQPYVGPFAGVLPTPKQDKSFDVWMLGIQSMKSIYCYSDISIVHAIWKSLRGQARNVTFTL